MPIQKSRIEGIRGSLSSLSGPFPLTIPYPFLCTPTIAVLETTKPVILLGSLDGAAFVPVRTLDGVQVRFTKPGVYRLPAPVLFLQVLCEDDAASIQTFAGASHE